MSKKAAKKKAPAPPKSKGVVRLSLKKDRLIITPLENEARFSPHGFGFFIFNVQKGEIEATQEAVDAILKQQYRRGVCPLEIFPNTEAGIGFCANNMDIREICLHDGAAKWFKDHVAIRT